MSLLFLSYLFMLGIISFMFGNYCSRNKMLKQEILRRLEAKCDFNNITIYLGFFLGIFLLLLYGLSFGITEKLLAGESIEGFRREVELGAGYLKIPGEFFTYFCGLTIATKHLIKKHKIDIFILIVLTTVAAMIFVTTGHKTYPILICLVFLLAFIRN